ncbi:MAG: hypothetical protein ACRDGR_07760 [bacterium]
MTNLIRIVLVPLLGSLCVFAPVARADTSFEFLFSSGNVTNDSQFLLHLAVGDYGYPRHVIEPMLPRLHCVEDDLPVILFLAAASGRPVEFIVGLRSEPLSWYAVFARVGVPYDVLFVGIDRDPGPPYGRAWGHWKKNPKACTLSDEDVQRFVNVQIGHRVTGLSAFDIARAEGQGKTVAVVVADKKGRPHQAQQGSPKGGKSHHGGKGGKGK